MACQRLGSEACFEMQTDRTKPITKDIIETAKEALIKRRDTHLDVLIDRLKEPRVHNIIDAIITGIDTSREFPSDDIQYVMDLGLVARRENKLVIANPIYQEVIPRELTYSTQLTMPQQQLWYVVPNGSLDMHKMLESFTEFYRENSADWLDEFDYKESGPHLLIDGVLATHNQWGGKIHREYACGTGRVHFLITWKTQRMVIELKVWRSEKITLIKGLEQTARYMDTSNATEGHLIIFDDHKRAGMRSFITGRRLLGIRLSPSGGCNHLLFSLFFSLALLVSLFTGKYAKRCHVHYFAKTAWARIRVNVRFTDQAVRFS